MCSDPDTNIVQRSTNLKPKRCEVPLTTNHCDLSQYLPQVKLSWDHYRPLLAFKGHTGGNSVNLLAR